MSTINTMPAFNFTKAVMASTLSATKKTVGLTKTLVKKVPVAVKNSWNTLPEEDKVAYTFAAASAFSYGVAFVYGATSKKGGRMAKTFKTASDIYACFGMAMALASQGVALAGAIRQGNEQIHQLHETSAEINQMSEEIKANAIKPTVHFESDIQPDYKLDEDETHIDHDQF